MFKGQKRIMYMFAALFAVVIVLQYALPKPTDWTKNYMAKSKAPFGTYAINHLLEKIYGKTTVVSTKTLYQLSERHEKNQVLIMVNDALTLNETDLRSLFDFLGEGNTAILAASAFEGALADSLHLLTDTDVETYFTSIDSLIAKEGETIRFNAHNLKRLAFKYPRLLEANYFSGFDSTRFKVLAHYDGNKACLISCGAGKGRLLLCSAPDVFSNYFIVDHPNRHFAYTVLAMAGNKEPIWDEHYKTYNVSNSSILKFIVESDALYIAYLLLILTLLLYLVFESRRRQRVIPVMIRPANTTLEFVNVISQVYYNSKNHRHIAAEKIKYFYETIRRRFNIASEAFGDLECGDIATLSGIEKKRVVQLFGYCERLMQPGTELTEYDLVELNRQMYNFNKNSLR